MTLRMTGTKAVKDTSADYLVQPQDIKRNLYYVNILWRNKPKDFNLSLQINMLTKSYPLPPQKKKHKRTNGNDVFRSKTMAYNHRTKSVLFESGARSVA